MPNQSMELSTLAVRYGGSTRSSSSAAAHAKSEYIDGDKREDRALISGGTSFVGLVTAGFLGMGALPVVGIAAFSGVAAYKALSQAAKRKLANALNAKEMVLVVRMTERAAVVGATDVGTLEFITEHDICEAPTGDKLALAEGGCWIDPVLTDLLEDSIPVKLELMARRNGTTLALGETVTNAKTLTRVGTVENLFSRFQNASVQFGDICWIKTEPIEWQGYLIHGGGSAC